MTIYVELIDFDKAIPWYHLCHDCGDKKGKGHIERAEKGIIPCYKSIQAKDEKGRGRVPKIYDRG